MNWIATKPLPTAKNTNFGGISPANLTGIYTNFLNYVFWRLTQMSYKAMAHIHSLNGEMAEITVLEEVGDNDYIVDYKGVKCHALFNWFVCQFYADDVYRRVEE